ncbi:hypothetical protein H311_01683 [Anncaliia algerae PRA109]|nr:hypothetical protein H311_02126 [Anncaliia algerae PRA109]KCZ77308.1 hypothetical protein H311_01683 [Anncaliia algerae PRA109]
MKKSVLLNIPNIICYLRLVLLILFIHYKNIIYYILSSSMDFLDGHAARKFNQCTFLGTILDMTIDRASNLVILLMSQVKSLLIINLVLLDFLSHFICFTVNVKKGLHHKSVSGIMSIYYNKKILFTLCAGSELYLLLLFTENKFVDYFVFFYYIKSFFHFIQLFNSLYEASEIN